jgi:hypothetical protein
MKGCVVALIVLVAVAAAMLTAQPDYSSHQTKNDAATQGPLTPTAFTKQDDAVSGTHAETTDNSSPQFYAALKRPDWWVVFIAFLTACAVAYQAKKSAEALEAMWASMELQEIALQQWVDLDNWRTNYRVRKDGSKELEVCFDIVNPTKLPLTLEAVTTTIANHTFATASRNFVAPNKTYTVNVTIPLSDEDAERFLGSTLVLSVRGDIAYSSDVHKDWRHQPFSAFLVCRKGQAPLVTSTSPMIPQRPSDQPASGEQS